LLRVKMIADELLRKPVWQAQDLGQPIPASTHAVSVALPRWEDVVGYEEKKPEVVERLSTGYPRFVVHPLVLELGRYIGRDQFCLPFPSARAAELAADFVRRAGDPTAKAVARDSINGTVVSEKGGAALRAFWQHTGLIISSRQASTVLD